MTGVQLKIINDQSKLLFNLPLITAQEIYAPGSVMFHDNGLFSTTIFGRQGMPERMINLGAIDLRIKIIHPMVYRAIVKLKKEYGAILEGKTYVTYSKETKGFILSDEMNGYTGFMYFLKHLPNLEFFDNDSDQRRSYIEVLDTYKGSSMLVSRWIVYPAGLRDYIIDTDGNPKEHEVNPLYRNLMTQTNMLNSLNIENMKPEILDPIRMSVQRSVNTIFNWYFEFIDGKTGFINKKVLTRSVAGGTRNVLTARVVDVGNINDMTDDNTTTTVGLFQFLKGNAPLAKFAIKDRFLSKFITIIGSDRMVDIKTLTTVDTTITDSDKKYWLGDDGLESIFNKFFQDDVRNMAVTISGYYLCLLEIIDDVITVIYDTRVEEYDPKFVRPITYAELFYLSIFDQVDDAKGLTVRYPILGKGSIFPARVTLKTTMVSRVMKLNSIDLPPDTEVKLFPIAKYRYFDTQSVFIGNLSGLGADHDGDQLSLLFLYSKESRQEVEDILSSPAYYLTTDQQINASADNPISRKILATLTKGE